MLNIPLPITNTPYYPTPNLDTRDDLVYLSPTVAAKNIKPPKITPEIKSMAEKIRELAVSLRDRLVAFIDKISNRSGGVKTTTRIKGDTGIASLENKISREIQSEAQEALRKALKTGNIEVAFSRIYDIFGARFLAKNQAEINKVFKALCSAIENGEFKPEYIFNYAGNGIQPYFTKEQMLELQALCREKGYEIKGTKPALGISITEDGYTSAHVNGTIKVIKDGLKKPVPVPTEIQIRTENIEEISNAMHIPYDVWNGKDILSGLSAEKRKTLEPIVEEYKSISNRKLDFYKYQTAYIKYKMQGGMSPKPQDYGLPESVAFEKIIELKKQL